MNTPPSTLTVAALCGSLRAGSYNRGLLRAAGELAPAGMRILPFDRLREVPHYDADLEAPAPPEPVEALRAAIRSADALLIASPEYNYGIPGLLKNAIDWLSRPPGRSVLNGKPAAILGASTGAFGTARGQLALRQTLASTDTLVLTRPEVFVAHSREKFDAEGRLTDPATREHVRRLLEALAAWARRLSLPDESAGARD